MEPTTEFSYGTNTNSAACTKQDRQSPDLPYKC